MYPVLAVCLNLRPAGRQVNRDLLINCFPYDLSRKKLRPCALVIMIRKALCLRVWCIFSYFGPPPAALLLRLSFGGRRKMALAGTKVLQKNEGKKLKFYDSAYLRYHVLRAVYDVKYFGDKGLGLRAVYVALGCSASEDPFGTSGQALGTGLYTHFPMRFANI